MSSLHISCRKAYNKFCNAGKCDQNLELECEITSVANLSNHNLKLFKSSHNKCFEEIYDDIRFSYLILF